MKVSVAALAVLLVVASFSLAVASPTGLGDSPCCQQHTSRRIRRENVKSFFYTSGNCRKPSVVFLLKSGHQVCADPTAKWAIDIVESLKPE